MNYKDYFRDLQEHRDQKGVFHVSGVAPDSIRYHGEGLSPITATGNMVELAPTRKGLEWDSHIGIVDVGTFQLWSVGRFDKSLRFDCRGWWAEIVPARKAGSGVTMLDGRDLADKQSRSEYLGRLADWYDIRDFDIQVVTINASDDKATCREAIHCIVLTLEFSFATPEQKMRFV